jgi:predicted lysophospholipase L1 biosynthesis ABC-type transport system permease subunit
MSFFKNKTEVIMKKLLMLLLVASATGSLMGANINFSACEKTTGLLGIGSSWNHLILFAMPGNSTFDDVKKALEKQKPDLRNVNYCIVKGGDCNKKNCALGCYGGISWRGAGCQVK